MKLTQTHYLIILAVAFGALAIYAIQVTSENNANKEAKEALQDSKKQEIEQLTIERDSVIRIKDSLVKAAENDFSEGEVLEEAKEKLKNEAYENEPYTINDADSLANIIARRFHDSKP